MIDKVKERGQVFTQQGEVAFALSLRTNAGRVLEPSAGNGAFSSQVECVSIELDHKVAPANALVMNFFDYPTSEQFETIIGNPPYVKGKLIDALTRTKFGSTLITEKGNLYLHFIEKCYHHLTSTGEIIFITPKDFLASKASEKLMNLMLSTGSFTHYYDHTGRNIFTNAMPDNVCVWRYQKGLYTNECMTNDGMKFLTFNEGRAVISSQQLSVPLNDLFLVKVGAVPGAGSKYFGGDTPFVYSKTRETGKVRMMNYVPKEWIRGITNSDADSERIYVNCKTRKPDPFFTHECVNWDGSVIALFPLVHMDISLAIDLMNSTNWEEMGFVWDGRYVFTQSSLSTLLLPEEFNQLQPDPLWI